MGKALKAGSIDADTERAFNMADKVRDRKEGKPTQAVDITGHQLLDVEVRVKLPGESHGDSN